jgi:isopenicillin N synthase-like dioxygenase
MLVGFDATKLTALSVSYMAVGQERQLFELPETEKARLVQRSHSLGTYLFSEGQFARADKMYQLVCA